MAARNRTWTPERWYVYRVNVNGSLAYVGKGSGTRYLKSAERLNGIGGVIKYFARETAAYSFEKKLVAELQPWANKVAGGGGSDSKYRPSDAAIEAKWEREAYERASSGHPIDILIAFAWARTRYDESLRNR